MSDAVAEGSTPAEANPRAPTFLLAVTRLECVVVFTAVALLFLAPARGGEDIWAWITPAFNARYIGAVYLAALVPLVTFALSGRWSPGRLVVWMILVFTGSIMVVMLGYADRFEWDRLFAWVFWALYIFLPFNAAYFLWSLRELPVAGRVPTATPWRLALTGLALALGAYGIALLAVPESATDFWPWPVDAFHGRIYAATFLAPAVGVWLVRQKGSPAEYQTVAFTLLALGVASILAVVLTSSNAPSIARVDYGELGTWAFFGMNAIVALAGAVLLRVRAAPGLSTSPS